jgi:lysozyme family protein
VTINGDARFEANETFSVTLSGATGGATLSDPTGVGTIVNDDANRVPVLVVPSANVAASPGQSLQASSLFSATDADGQALLYYLYDGTTSASSGHFVVNGTVMQAGVTHTVTAAQLAQTTFVAGTVADTVFVQATDSVAISNTGRIVINNHAPVVTAPSANVSASAGQSLTASSLFNATDVDGQALLYYLYDGTTSASSGHFVVNGTVMQAGVTHTVTAAQWAQTTFVAGTVSDTVFVQATDTIALSNTGRVNVNVAAPNPAEPPSSAQGNESNAFVFRSSLEQPANGFADDTANGNNFACAFPEISKTTHDDVLDHTNSEPISSGNSVASAALIFRNDLPEPANRFAQYQANGDSFSCAFPEISEIVRGNVVDHIAESFDALFQIAHVVNQATDHHIL